MRIQFDSFADLLAMDGHGLYVWASYGVVLVVLSALWLLPLVRQRRFFQREARRQQLQSGPKTGNIAGNVASNITTESQPRESSR